MLEVIAKKLGLSDEFILKKASEIYRLLQTKTASNQQLGLSACAQHVVCLELAANMRGTPVDRGVAIKLSGMTKKNYLLQLYTVEKLLNIQPESTVQDMCLRLGCMELCQLANRLLNRHKDTSQLTEKDHPMYAAGAIFTVAKHQKVAVDKQKLAELGRTRPIKLDSVHSLMGKTLSQMVGVKKSAPRGPKSRGHALLDLINNLDNVTSVTEKNQGDEKEEPEEDFEEWKRRMLGETEAVTNQE